MKLVKLAEGKVEIHDYKYQYEFYSDNKEVYVKIFHPGKNGDVTEFTRNDKVNLKTDMDNALVRSGVLS